MLDRQSRIAPAGAVPLVRNSEIVESYLRLFGNKIDTTKQRCSCLSLMLKGT